MNKPVTEWIVCQSVAILAGVAICVLSFFQNDSFMEIVLIILVGLAFFLVGLIPLILVLSGKYYVVKEHRTLPRSRYGKTVFKLYKN